MKILYASALSSERLINMLFVNKRCNPGFAMQKFARLIVKGIHHNGVEISTLTNPPINRTLLSDIFVCFKTEKENGISYKYIPFFNFPLLKHFCVIVYSFLYTLFWGMYDRKNKLLLCDVINVSICVGTLMAAKILRIKTACVVTDIYGLMIGENKGRLSSLVSYLAHKFYNIYANSFDKYILLTEQMNEKVNLYKKPYIVIEALCDTDLLIENNEYLKKNNPRTVLYAGGLFEQYGVKMLVEAFIKSNVDAKLILYGSGTFVKELNSVYSAYSNIDYRGVASNEEVIIEEYKSSLLVNPRFSSEEFTKYSFPSKNMEYMVSGTPLLANKLSGMPNEYDSFVYLFEEETVEGYARTLNKLLSYPEEELNKFGSAARKFVVENKNYITQGEKLVFFLLRN